MVKKQQKMKSFDVSFVVVLN